MNRFAGIRRLGGLLLLLLATLALSAACVGDPGARGAAGPKGDQGIQGVQGTQGLAGVQGDPASAAGAATLMTDVAQVSTGGFFTVSGAGVDAGEVVLVVMQVGGLLQEFSLGTGTADERGVFSFTYKGRSKGGLPAGIENGMYSLRAINADGVVIASTGIEVTDPPPPPEPQPQFGNALVVAPNKVCHGEFISGMVSGFMEDELVVVTMAVGGDIGDLILTSGEVGESGALGWVFKARSNSGVSDEIAPGVYTVMVEGTLGSFATAPVQIQALVADKCVRGPA